MFYTGRARQCLWGRVHMLGRPECCGSGIVGMGKALLSALTLMLVLGL